MAHKHSVYDSDNHFSIDPMTRNITNTGSKVIIAQYDHNSERFTFEIPRYVEEHDMSLCNRVEIHYINVDASTREQATGVYEIEDLQIAPEDEEVVILSWLISQNATSHAGTLNFLIRFACLTDDVIDYQWFTTIHSGISITSGMINSEDIVEQYTDILEQWERRVVNPIETIEQTVESTAYGGINEITITLADGRTSKVYVRNGSWGELAWVTNEDVDAMFEGVYVGTDYPEDQVGYPIDFKVNENGELEVTYG